jgi:hypothetical protein
MSCRFGLGQAHRDGLLAQHVHAEVEEVPRDLGVARRGRAHDHRLGLAVHQPAMVHDRRAAVLLADTPGHVLADVRHADEAHLCESLERLEVRLGDPAAADERDLERRVRTAHR